MVDNSKKIFDAYKYSNILIGLATDRVDDFDTVEYWLASMGMLDTLIIMGADASIYEYYCQ